MSKTTLCLVRHGQTDWNKDQLIQGLTDNPLNDLGVAQAHAAGKFINTEASMPKWDIIISSPLTRAHKTAQIIATHLNYTGEIILIDDFKERDFGLASGQHVDDYYQAVMEDNVDLMERHDELITRVRRGLDYVTTTYKNKNILIVCHSHTIKAAIIQISNYAYDFTLKLDNTSLSLIEHQDLTYRLIAHNISDHTTF